MEKAPGNKAAFVDPNTSDGPQRRATLQIVLDGYSGKGALTVGVRVDCWCAVCVLFAALSDRHRRCLNLLWTCQPACLQPPSPPASWRQT